MQECSKDPVTIFPSDGWKKFPHNNLPSNFNYGHIYHYLVESISGENDSDASDDGTTTTEKPLRKGKSLVDSKFIENIQDNVLITNGAYYVRAEVHHSMKKQEPLKVFISLSGKTGFILKAQCNCKSSALSRCCHIAALLLYLFNYVEEHGHTVSMPSTSLPCTWNKGKKRKNNPKSAQEPLYNKKHRNSRIMNWDPRPPANRIKKTTDETNKFISDLQVRISFYYLVRVVNKETTIS